ncbi:MAG: M14 family zinc carboxypeptidase [Burkholderiales bacterium]
MKTAWLAALLCLALPAYAAAPCDEFARRLPNVSQALCDAAGLQPGLGRSVQGRPLWWRDVLPQSVLDGPVGSAAFKVLVVGAIHGDELSSAALAFHWIGQASQAQTQVQALQGAAQPAASALPMTLPMNRVHWRFVPVLNPDGLLARPPKRVNARGVDLNRNFPTRNWAQDARHYWEKRTRKDPRRWPGNAPLSEPESAFLHAQIASFKPNLIVSIHAPYGVLDFDGPVGDKLVPPARLGRLYLDQVGIFPGSLGNYGGLHQGVPVVTVELPNATRTPLNAEMRQMWQDLLRWMSERLLTPSANPANGPLSAPGMAAPANALPLP